MAKSAVANVLGFIPFFASVLVVVMLLIYKPEHYGVIVGAIVFSYVFGGTVMYFAVKRARKLKNG
jgi:ABC-type Na+ efflux pump permease subunit